MKVQTLPAGIWRNAFFIGRSQNMGIKLSPMGKIMPPPVQVNKLNKSFAESVLSYLLNVVTYFDIDPSSYTVRVYGDRHTKMTCKKLMLLSIKMTFGRCTHTAPAFDIA